MKFTDILKKKISKKELNVYETDYIVENYSNDNISENEMTQLLDAFMKFGMSEKETMDFFDATYKRAHIIEPKAKKEFFTIDKHASGGIGDKVSLILLPLLHALGVKVFKLSGGRLDFTGGTIEKLSSFPKMQLKISPRKFEKWAQEKDVLISYAHDEISVFEKKLYHLRSVSKKVGILGMIVNSIMIKKIILKNTGLIINLKIGTGTFFKTMEEGLAFAKIAGKIAKRYQRKIVFIFSDMNQPLGSAVGNKIEVLEAMNYLEGNAYHLKDLDELIKVHVHEALNMINPKQTFLQTEKKIRQIIGSKKAIKSFRHLVENQSGNFDHIFHDRQIHTRHCLEIKSWKEGYLIFKDASKIGNLVNEINLNANKIDYEVGLKVWKKHGDFIKKDELIATIWTNWNNQNAVNKLSQNFNQAIDIQKNKTKWIVQVKKIIRNF